MSKHTTLEQLKLAQQRTKSEVDKVSTRVGTLEGAGYQTAQNVTDAINAKIASTYKAGGSVTFANLPALSAANEGKVVNITDANGFTTTADFVEGAGNTYPAGTNVVVINTGTTEAPVYKYDVLAGFVDLSGYQSKVSGATSGNIATLDANGQVTDSGSKPSDFLTAHQDISGKADKVSSGVEGNFVSLDANGNIQDSGSKPGDFLTAHQDISGKADKDADAVSGNVAKFDANGNPVDSGVAATSLITSVAKGTKDGTISVNGGADVTIVEEATDAEVTAMLNEVWGTPTEA